MRILLTAVGSRGDVQPMLALGVRLRERGHAVTLCAPPNMETWVRGHGVPFHPLGRDFQAFLDEFGTRVHAALPAMRDEVRLQFRVLAELAGQADVILGAAVSAAGSSLAEKHGIPHGYVGFSPSLFPSRSHPAPLCPWQHLPGWLNAVTWWSTRRLWNGFFRGLINEERARLGLAPVSDVWTHLMGGSILLASEPALAPPPADGPSDVTQTGAWLLPEADALPADLEAFLQAGPPPVYIGFGSMTDSDPARTTRMLLEAVRGAGVRALISEGWARLGASALPPEVFRVGPLPHSKLFPRVLGVVHHGGAGTLTAAARAGVPQLLVPHLMDQFYWAERVREHGLGPPAIPRPRLAARNLEAALRVLADDAALRERARAFAGTLRADGLERAVQHIEEGRLAVPGAAALQLAS